MFRFIFSLSMALALMLTGCATAEKSTLLGTAIGSTVGASIGLMASQNSSPSMKTQGALIGVGVGGLLGALIGHDVYKRQAKKDETQNFDVNSAQLEMFGAAGEQGKRPQLKPAQVRVRYVEDQIKDGVFVPAHFEYEIAEPARWEKSK